MGSTIIHGADYWQNLEITSSDLQRLTSHLFEKEEPLTLDAMVEVLIELRLEDLKAENAKHLDELGQVYLPQNTYALGSKVLFPGSNWESGTVVAERPGKNPDLGEFTVTTIKFENSERDYATGLEGHPLSLSESQTKSAEVLDLTEIKASFGNEIRSKLRSALTSQKELVRIGHTWFPKSLLIKIGKGELNLAEAILDGLNGGPIAIQELLDQLEIVSEGENKKLAEFSLNYALQEDPRFDEVGTAGKFSWFLERLEPVSVRETPIYLRLPADPKPTDEISEETQKIFETLDDEYAFNEDAFQEDKRLESTQVTLNFPHWRAGSLPITPATYQVFPSALETNHVKLSFLDEQSGERISAWVVRKGRYVIGLRDWYEAQNLIPGSVIEISKTNEPDVLTIRAEKKRSSKEWIKTVLIGADGGLVFALLRQPIYAGFNDRMAIAIPDVAGLDAIWSNRENKMPSFKSDVTRMMSELSKLNNQRHVHFIDLYAALNVIRRTPPQDLLHILSTSAEFTHVGDFYFHLSESA